MTKKQSRDNSVQFTYWVSLDSEDHAPVREAINLARRQKRDVSALVRTGVVLAMALENHDYATLARMLPLDVMQALLPAPTPITVEVQMPQWATGVQMPLPLMERKEVEAEFDIEDLGAAQVAQNLTSLAHLF